MIDNDGIEYLTLQQEWARTRELWHTRGPVWRVKFASVLALPPVLAVANLWLWLR